MVKDRFWKAATSCLFILLFSISLGQGTGYAAISYQFVTAWGYAESGLFNHPFGVAVDPADVGRPGGHVQGQAVVVHQAGPGGQALDGQVEVDRRVRRPGD